MSDDTKVPWSDLSRTEKEEFAALCDRFVGLDTVEDAEQYYGNKEKLIADSKAVTDE